MATTYKKNQENMTRRGSSCGACLFLRRKCVTGCVFAPYFCHEQGATDFAAVHTVFGASNASKLLAHLPLNERYEGACTIWYEAQARVQDPIYGCVSQILALQQQVLNLQAQLAYLKEQAAQCRINPPIFTQDVQNWWQNQGDMPQFDAKFDMAMNFTQDVQNWWLNQGGMPQFDAKFDMAMNSI